jgi:hypothetical protein
MERNREGASCDFCASPIPESDFEKGYAVVVLKKRYCRVCMVEAIEGGKDPEKLPQFMTPRPAPLLPSFKKSKKRPAK